MEQKSYSEAKTVQKALRILEMLGKQQPLSPSEISEQLKLSRSNVHRLLFTLEEMGYVEKKLDAKYYLGIKTFILGSNYFTTDNLSDIAYPHMKILADICQENVNLGVMYEHRVLYLNKIESPHNLKLDTPMGKMDPLHCTGLGKALLSGLTDQELEAYCESVELTKRTSKSIVDPHALIEHIRQVREQGVAFDFEEFDKGVHCMAGPIYNHAKRVAAAISVSGPSVRFTRQVIKNLKPHLAECCTAVAEKLGYRPGAEHS
jgi:DNA-binding IclR family transcriptional regulator